MGVTKGIVSGGNYTFDAVAKTITFSNDYLGMSLSDITYITNIKSGVATVIYDPFDPLKGGVLNGLVLTLAFNTTGMSNTDPLQIIVGFTPATADPLAVKIVEGPDQKDDTAFLESIANNLDYLNLALDQSEGIQVNTREVNPAQRDENNATVLSDYKIVRTNLSGPNNFNASGQTFEVDTLGYNSIIFVFTTGSGAPSINYQVDSSNDRSTYFFIPYGVATTGGTFSLAAAGIQSGAFNANTTYNVLVNNVGRYTRLRFTSLSGTTVTAYAILRNLLFNSAYSTLQQNIQTVAGSTPGTTVGVSTNAGAGLTNSGGISISGYYPPSTNVPNALPNNNTQVPYPIGIAGREWPNMGAFAGFYRYITVDAQGRLQLSGDTAFRTPNMGGPLEQSQAGTARGIGSIPSNIVGSQSITVTDTSQSEGDTNTMLLKQILQELKILNQQIIEIPFLLNMGENIMSDPQEYRDDKSTLF